MRRSFRDGSPISALTSVASAFIRQRSQNPTAKSWRTHCNDIKDGYAWNLSILNQSSLSGLEFEHRIVEAL